MRTSTNKPTLDRNTRRGKRIDATDCCRVSWSPYFLGFSIYVLIFYALSFGWPLALCEMWITVPFGPINRLSNIILPFHREVIILKAQQVLNFVVINLRRYRSIENLR